MTHLMQIGRGPGGDTSVEEPWGEGGEGVGSPFEGQRRERGDLLRARVAGGADVGEQPRDSGGAGDGDPLAATAAGGACLRDPPRGGRGQ